jgi:hypothetical protein
MIVAAPKRKEVEGHSETYFYNHANNTATASAFFENAGEESLKDSNVQASKCNCF